MFGKFEQWVQQVSQEWFDNDPALPENREPELPQVAWESHGRVVSVLDRQLPKDLPKGSLVDVRF